ncbi:hypothetical protein VTK73DRAFT_9836 [Phialemonium thermophilum]|uniref:Uncharacterized protein n=1 Tax=Phialemonium thermophilum TaxID=223376 RepID=A0ABR3W006_9PEZI
MMKVDRAQYQSRLAVPVLCRMGFSTICAAAFLGQHLPNFFFPLVQSLHTWPLQAAQDDGSQPPPLPPPLRAAGPLYGVGSERVWGSHLAGFDRARQRDDGGGRLATELWALRKQIVRILPFSIEPGRRGSSGGDNYNAVQAIHIQLPGAQCTPCLGTREDADSPKWSLQMSKPRTVRGSKDDSSVAGSANG